ncbi:MAG TPA: hypothetical protein ENN39_09715 [Desulfonatronum sp.]|nr:hypothetical protein [Desulfonatronum sp.]
MPSVGESYKCELYGNVVEVKEADSDELTWCEEPMNMAVFKENVWMSVGSGESADE